MGALGLSGSRAFGPTMADEPKWRREAPWAGVTLVEEIACISLTRHTTIALHHCRPSPAPALLLRGGSRFLGGPIARATVGEYLWGGEGRGGGRRGGYVLSSFRWSSWWPARLLILLHVPPLDSEPPVVWRPFRGGLQTATRGHWPERRRRASQGARRSTRRRQTRSGARPIARSG